MFAINYNRNADPRGVTPALVAGNPDAEAAFAEILRTQTAADEYNERVEIAAAKHRDAQRVYAEKIRDAAAAGTDLAKVTAPGPAPTPNRIIETALTEQAQTAAARLRDALLPHADDYAAARLPELDKLETQIREALDKVQQLIGQHRTLDARRRWMRLMSRWGDLPSMPTERTGDADFTALLQSLDYHEAEAEHTVHTAIRDANEAAGTPREHDTARALNTAHEALAAARHG